MVLTFKRSLENVKCSAILYYETITVYCQVLLNSCLFNKPLNEWILKYIYVSDRGSDGFKQNVAFRFLVANSQLIFLIGYIA